MNKKQKKRIEFLKQKSRDLTKAWLGSLLH